MENIHFLHCSNKVNALTMAKDLVESFLNLKNGVHMFDAMLDQEVLVLAPVLYIMADNSISSKLCNRPVPSLS